MNTYIFFALIQLLTFYFLHSSTLAWKIPWTEEPGGLAVHGVAEGRTQLNNFTFTFHFHALEKEMATHPVFLPGESQGGSPSGESGGLP